MSYDADVRGYDFVSWNLCADHITDPDLRNAVEGRISESRCSFCSRAHSDGIPFAVSGEDLMVPIMREFGERYEDPAESLPWDSREGGYQGLLVDTDEAVVAVLHGYFSDDVEEEVLGAIIAAIGPLKDWAETIYDTE